VKKKQKVEKLVQDFETKLNGPFKSLILQSKQRLEIPLPQHAKDSEALYAHTPSTEDGEDYQALLARQREEQELVTLQDDTDFQDAIIYEREKEIKEIQVQMIQVNEIFKDLAKLVEDQGEMVDNIQTNISNVSAHVGTAVDEVKEAQTSQQSSRRKYCYLAIAVTLIVSILVGVVVLVIKTRET